MAVFIKQLGATWPRVGLNVKMKSRSQQRTQTVAADE